MAKAPNYEAIFNTFVQHADHELIQAVMEDLGPRECHEVERRFVYFREMQEEADKHTAKRKAGKR